MASKRYTEFNVKFGITGMEEIYNAQKKLATNAEREMKAAEHDLEVVKNAAGETSAAYEAQKLKLDKLTEVYKQFAAALEKVKKDANTLNYVLTHMDSAGPAQLKKASNAIKAGIDRMGELGKYDADGKITGWKEDKNERLRGLATIKEQMDSYLAAMRKGVVDMERPLADNQTAWNELHNIVKMFEQDGRIMASYADDQKASFEKMGSAATQAKIRMAEIEGVIKNITTASKEELREMEKFYDGITKYQGATAQQKADAKAELDKVRTQMSRENLKIVDNVKGAAAGTATALYSKKESAEAIEWLKKYVNETNLAANTRKQLTQAIREGEEAMKLNAQNDDMQYYTRQFSQLGTISKDALSEQLKYWQEVASAAKNGTARYDEAAARVRKLNEEIQRRKSIETTKDGEAALTRLNQGYANSTDRLKQMREHLEAYRKTLDSTKADKLKQVNKALNDIARQEAQNLTAAHDYNNLLSRIKKEPLVELKKAYDALVKETETLDKGTSKYRENVRRMLTISKEIRERSKDFKEHASTIRNAADRLKNYFLVYVGAQKIMDKVREAFRQTVELSDKMTTVQKISGLTADEVGGLVSSLQSIDTRATTPQLMDLAAEASKLGIASSQGAQGIYEFVKAGNQIQSTLGELGTESVAQLLKVNDLVNKTSMGVEQDLLKIGSAVLSIGNNSKATYKDVVDFTTRMGAIGSTAGLTMQEIMALGGSFSALGGKVDSSSTAMQRILMGLVSKTTEVAKVANVSTNELKGLIDQGKTMDALMVVLDRLSTQGVEGVLAFLEAIGGRNNTQAKAALTLLTQNINVLQYQLSLANEGYEDGILVTQEYEKANNNLAGTMQRVNNEFYKMVTDENTVNFFTPFAKGLLWVVQLLNKSSVLLAAFAGVISYLGISLLAAATKINMVNTALTAFKTNILAGLKVGGLFLVYLKNMTLSLFGVQGASTKAAASLRSLKTASSATWVTALVTGLVVLATWLAKIKSNAEDAKKAMGELANKSAAESAQLNYIASQLKKANVQGQERLRLVTTFNKLFGTYLSKLISEKSTVHELAKAYREAAQAIHEKNAAEIRGEGHKRAYDENKDDIDSASAGIINTLSGTKSLNGGKGISKGVAGIMGQQMMAFIRDYASENLGATEEEILKAFQDKYKDDPNFLLDTGGGKKYNFISGTTTFKNGKVDSTIRDSKLISSIKDYIKVAQKMATTVSNAETAAGVEDEMAVTQELEKLKDMQKAIFDTNEETRLSDKDRYDYINEYLKIYEKYSTDALYKDNVVVKQAKGVSIKMRKLLPDLVKVVKPWGTPSDTWETMGGEELKAVIDWFESISKSSRTGFNVKETLASSKPNGVELPTGIESWGQQNIKDWAYAQATKAREIQKRNNNMSRSATYEWDDKKSRTKTPESDSALAELDRYYLDREENIKRALADERITEAEHNRMKLANDKEHYEQRALLRKYFDGTMNADETKAFQDWWASTKDLDKAFWQDVQNLDKVSWTKITEEWNKADDKAKSENRKARQKDLTQIQSDAAKAAQAIANALLEDLPTEKVMQSLQKTLDDIGVLVADKSQHASILTSLRSLFSKMQSMTKEEFIEEFKKIPTLAQLLTGNEEEDIKRLQVYFSKLGEASEAYDNAIRQQANKQKKITDMKAKGNSNLLGMDKNLQDLNAKEGLAENLDSLGIGSDMRTADMKVSIAQQELEMAREKVQLSLQAYDVELMVLEAKMKELEIAEMVADAEGRDEDALALREEYAQVELDYQDKKMEMMAATEEVRANFLNKQQALDEAERNSVETRLNYLKNYTDAFESFGYSMGEAAFGSKEDRQNAAKELLKSVMESTKKIMMVKLQELIFEKTLSKSKIAVQQAENTTLTSLAGQQVMTDLTVKSAEVPADVAAGTASGGAKTIGKLGWWGIPLLAVIGAALSALMGVAMGALSKAESEVASVSGISAGKMATGMLTYAKGRYPRYAEGSMSGSVSDTSGGGVISQGTMRDGTNYTVTAADGHTYNATYQPLLSTAEYTRPHLGIVGEAGAELIVDHPTLQNLKTTRRGQEALNTIYAAHRYGRTALNYPALDRSAQVLALQQQRSINRFASGNVEAVLSQQSLEAMTSTVPGDQSQGQDNSRMIESLDRFTSLMENIQENGIKAHMAMYGDDGFMEQHAAAKRYYDRIGKSY